MDLASGLHQSGVLSYRFCSNSRVLYKFCNLKRRNGKFSWSFHLRCQLNDSLAFVDGNNQSVEVGNSMGDEKEDTHKLDDLRELLQKAIKELEVSRLSDTTFEERALRILELAIDLKDKAENAWKDVTAAVSTMQEIIQEEITAKEAVEKATMALSIGEARLQSARDAMASRKEVPDLVGSSLFSDGTDEILSGKEETKECKMTLEKLEVKLRRIQAKKAELQKEADRLNEIVQQADRTNFFHCLLDCTAVVHCPIASIADNILPGLII